jgi:hypothetical protein
MLTGPDMCDAMCHGVWRVHRRINTIELMAHLPERGEVDSGQSVRP